MAVAPLNKFLTIAVPVTPSNQQVYEATQGTSAIILYTAVANVGIGQSYPLVSFTHRRTSKATRTNGNIRDIRLIKDVEVLPEGILFWRSITHWLGGMGMIVFAIAILPLLGIGGMQLFNAESPGPSTDKLHPRITDTAKRLWLIYVSYTIIETIFLKIAGMSFFDAINHSMSNIASGGFSTKNASLGHWNSNPCLLYTSPSPRDRG